MGRPPVLGIALGGGAARGLAHLGVLQVLREHGIRFDVVTGTSFGALVGAAVLGHGDDVEAVIDRVIAYVRSPEFRQSQLNFFRRRRDIERTGLLYSLRSLVKRGIYYGFSMTRASFVAPEEFRTSIDAIIPDARIEDLPRRFAAVAADIQSGEEVVFDRGSLRVAVRASCAIPGVLPPEPVGHGRTCIDGGWVNKVPADTCHALGADLVMAVDVSDDLADTVDLTSGLNVIMRGDAIKSHRLKMVQLGRADHVIHVPLTHVDWADFPRAEEIIGIGRTAAEDSLPALEDLLDRAGSTRASVRRSVERWVRTSGLVKRRRPALVTVEALRAPAPAPEGEPVAGTAGGPAGEPGPLHVPADPVRED